MPSLFVLPRQVPLSSAGALLAGAKLVFSATGTSTPQNTYSDAALTTPNANPVIADGNGVFSAIYLDPSLPDYRVILKTSADVVLYTQDGIPSNQNTAQTFRLKSPTPELIFEETDASSNNKNWRIQVNGETMRIQLGDDAESVWADMVTIPRSTGVWTFNTALLQIGVFPVATGTSGHFTGTLTGMTGSVTGEFYWSRVGSQVRIYLLAGIAVTGTSNTTAMTLTGVPSTIWPAASRSCPCTVEDNGTTLCAGLATITTSTITFYKLSGTNYSATGFTNSGTKGLDGFFSIGYDLGGNPF